MRTQQQYFDEYAVSHQNKTNQIIHYFCVPAIYFSAIGLVMSINPSFLQKTIGLGNPLIENWSTILLIPIFLFYIKMSFSTFLKMFVFSILCVVGNYYLGQYVNLLYASLVIFAIAWVVQFIGHKIEGAKPSFLQDLQFLLIGPPWVFKKLIG